MKALLQNTYSNGKHLLSYGIRACISGPEFAAGSSFFGLNGKVLEKRAGKCNSKRPAFQSNEPIFSKVVLMRVEVNILDIVISRCRRYLFLDHRIPWVRTKIVLSLNTGHHCP